jgi:hypothetical protein
VQESTRTADRRNAQEYDDRRRAELWRQVQFGERPNYTGEDAVLKWLEETAYKRDHEGDKQRLAALYDDLKGLPLPNITQDRLNNVLTKRPQLKTPGARNR